MIDGTASDQMLGRAAGSETASVSTVAKVAQSGFRSGLPGAMPALLLASARSAAPHFAYSSPTSDRGFIIMAMPSFTDIGVTRSGHIATVEIQRPPHNFFDFSLIGQIADAFEALDEDHDCRAIVLAAEGKSFCAGANFGTGRDDTGEAERQDSLNGIGILYREAVRLFRCKKPVIAAVQGPAIGGGLGLALAADFRVAAPEARFSANFVKLGFHQGFGLSVTLPALVGQQTASLMLLTGRRIPGSEAVRLGLADVLVSQQDLRGAAESLAGEIADNAPLAIVAIRATLREGLADRIAAATEHELREQQRLRATEDYREGVRAVAERRPGDFKGR
jgi:enoyl-CoA hydratase/carnithine racemase